MAAKTVSALSGTILEGAARGASGGLCRLLYPLLPPMSSAMHASQPWIALSLGNTHQRWGYGQGQHLLETWVCPHPPVPPTCSKLDWAAWQGQSPALATYAQHHSSPFPPLWLASVVPRQAAFWQTYPACHSLTTEMIPLGGLYSTLGVDRALALWAAGSRYGWPVLVIDGGTALTFSGADAQAQFVGGAIVPGLRLQLHSLATATALPDVAVPSSEPMRWAKDTPTALQSGGFYTLLASITDFVQAWQSQYPQTALVFTGGDAPTLMAGLKTHTRRPHPAWLAHLQWEPQLVFQGIVLGRQYCLQSWDARPPV